MNDTAPDVGEHEGSIPSFVTYLEAVSKWTIRPLM